uniref:Thylakoid lumenal 15 kDa protein n=1 Tax=Rhizophora mucronata TaxID=61149 RepID=A0A2P2L741_RHIMU
MALLNVSLCTKIPPRHSRLFSNSKPPSFTIPHSSSRSPTPTPLVVAVVNKQIKDLAKTSWLALLSASLVFIDPALAFKGGGPYGAEVTRGQDLSGKDFSGKALIKQDFKTSILRQANFKGAKLLGASFFDADLTGADLSDADLRGADFSLANVTKVNLSNANLEGALATGNTSFRGSNITGAGIVETAVSDFHA